MKTSETKIATPARRQQNNTSNKPFFQLKGEGSFFSESSNSPFGPQKEEGPFFGGQEKKTPFFTPTTIQPKLTIGQAGDQYEQEADAMAEQVTNDIAQRKESSTQEANSQQPTTNSFFSTANSQMPIAKSPSIINRKTDPQELNLKEEQDDTQEEDIQLKPIFESNADPGDDNPNVQTKGADGAQTASPDLQTQLDSSKGSGQSLPDDTRSQMETSFGQDFSDVKVHTDSNASQMNKGLNAQAFTHGSDIYFNDGKYDTGSQDGQKLLAHELTHVVQQGGVGGTIQRGGGEEEDRSVLEISEFPWNGRIKKQGAGFHKEPKTAAGNEDYIRPDFNFHDEVTILEKAKNNWLKAQRIRAGEIEVGYLDWRLVEQVGVLRGMARAAAKSGATITAINKTGIVFNSTGAMLYKKAVRPENGDSYEDNEIKEIEFNIKLNVLQEISGGWYRIQEKISGNTAYVKKSLVRTNLPHEFATYHIVQSGETAIGIAEKYYKGVSVMEDDLRDFVDYLVYLNKGAGDPTKGIYKNNPTDKWNETKVDANDHIWITPSGTAYKWVKENGKYAGHNVIVRTADESLEFLLQHTPAAFLVDVMESMPLDKKIKLVKKSLREQNVFLRTLIENASTFSTTMGLIGPLTGLPPIVGFGWQSALFEFALNVLIGRNQAMLAMSDKELNALSLNLLRAQLDPEYYYGLVTGVGGGIINWFVDIADMIGMIVKIAYFFTPVGMAQWIIKHQDDIEETTENLEKLAEYISTNKAEIIEEFSSLTVEDVRDGIKDFVAGFAQEQGGKMAQKLLGFNQKTPYEIGYGIGEIIGYIIPEILLAVFSAAIGNVLKGALKVVSKLFKWLMEAGQIILRSLSKIRKTLGFIDEILDIFRRIKLGGNKNKFLKSLEEFFEEMKKFFSKKETRLLEKHGDELIDGLKNTRRGTKEEIEIAAERIKNHRKTVKNPKDGNYGFLDGEVNGIKFDGDEMVRSGPPDSGIEEIFKAIEVEGSGGKSWVRNTDSEYKMLNRLANELGAKPGNTYEGITGTLKIVSENPYCTSCQGMIHQFNQMFPNVKLILIDGVK